VFIPYYAVQQISKSSSFVCQDSQHVKNNHHVRIEYSRNDFVKFGVQNTSAPLAS
jgi:hypothetical protein